MPAWPATLPASPLVNGFSESAPNTSLRTEMDQGPAKIRQRTTAAVRNITARFVLNNAQVADLETFFTTTLAGGSLGFDFTHPRTGVLETARFVTPPDYLPLGNGYYRVLAELELLP